MLTKFLGFFSNAPRTLDSKVTAHFKAGDKLSTQIGRAEEGTAQALEQLAQKQAELRNVRARLHGRN